MMKEHVVYTERFQKAVRKWMAIKNCTEEEAVAYIINWGITTADTLISGNELFYGKPGKSKRHFLLREW